MESVFNYGTGKRKLKFFFCKLKSILKCDFIIVRFAELQNFKIFLKFFLKKIKFEPK